MEPVYDDVQQEAVELAHDILNTLKDGAEQLVSHLEEMVENACAGQDAVDAMDRVRAILEDEVASLLPVGLDV